MNARMHARVLLNAAYLSAKGSTNLAIHNGKNKA